MATINAISVALFNAAAGGYSAEMTANGAAFANAVGPVLEKDISTDALFVEHLLGNLGVTSSNAVYAQAKAAVAGLVAAKGRLGATVDAVDFLKAQEGSTSAYATIAANFAAKVNTAAAFTAANATERDITKLVSAITGVDTDAAAISAAAAAATAAAEATAAAAATAAATAAAAAAATAAAEAKAAAEKVAADAAAAAKTAADAAAATAAAEAKAAADAAATKAAADLAAVDNTTYASEQAALDAANAAAATAAAAAAAKAAADLAAANAEILLLKNPVGTLSALTTSADMFVGASGGNDSITGTQATLGADIIVDGSTTDSDTLTIASTGSASSSTATIVNIENIVVNTTSFGTATFNATGVKTGTITMNQLQSGSTGAATVNGGVNSLTINAGTGAKGTLTVDNIVAGSTVVVNANADVTTVTTTTAGADGKMTIKGGAATGTATAVADIIDVTVTKASSTVNIDGVGATAAATVSIGESATITNGAAVAVDTLNISSSFAATTSKTATATIGNAGPTKSTTISGSNDVIVQGSSAFFDTLTVTDESSAKATLKLTTVATADLSKVSVDVIDVAAAAAGAATISLNDKATVKLSSNVNAGGLTIDADNDVANTSTVYLKGTVNVDLAAAITAGSLTVDAAGASDDGFDTVNLTVSTAQTGLALVTASTTVVTAAGSKDLVLAATSTAKSLNASTMTGAVTVNYDNTSDIITVTTGSGNDTFTNATTAIGTAVTITSGAGLDTFTMLTAAKATIDGGADYDTVNLVGDITSLKLSNIEELATTGAVTAAKTSQLSGKSFIMSGANAFTFGTSASNFDTDTIDLSSLTVNNVTGFTVDASNGLSTALYTAVTGATIIGSSIADTLKGTANADTINGGNGNDTLVGNAGDDNITGGAGSDAIDGGAGADTIILTETTAAADTVSFTAAVTADTTANADTVVNFKTTSDKLSFDAITVAGGGAIAATTGTGVTSGGVTAGALTDDTIYVISKGATALTAAGTQSIEDYLDLADVAAYLNEGYTSTADNDAAIFVINDLVGKKTYVYLFDEQTGGASTIQKADLSLVGIVTEVASKALVAGDIA